MAVTQRWTVTKALWFLLCVTLFPGLSLAQNDQRSPSPARRDFQRHQKELEELKGLARKGGHPNPNNVTRYDPDVCYSYECIEAAREIMFATNFTVNPCTFGNWLKFTCVRRTMHAKEGNDDELDDMHQQGQVGFLGFVAVGQTLAMLESKNLSPIMKKAAIYYEQCEKWRHHTDKQVQVDAIAKYLSKFGEWPLLTGKQSPGSKFNWTKMMANTMRVAVAYGVAPYLFDMFMEEGNIPLLFSGDLDLHKDDQEIVEIIKILSKGRRNITTNEKQIKEMKDFFAKLAHPSEDKIETQTIKQISASHDFGKNFKLEDFYKQMLVGTHMKITPETKVASDIPWLVQQVKTVNEAHPRVIANILFLQMAVALMARLTTLSHPKDLPVLGKYKSHESMDCVQETYEKFDFAMSHEYIRRHYDHRGTSFLVKLMDNLKVGYVNAIKNSKFLTSQAKAFAENKAKDIHTFIAAENWVMDEKNLQEYYKHLNVTKEQDFVTNHVNGLSFHWTKFLELKNPNVFNYIVGDAYTGYVSTRYNHHFNQIRIQAAVAQKPLFSYRYPGFMNYGGIGTVLSHEIAHSFDTNGVHFDKNGHRGEFWDAKSYEGYYNWTDSIVDDYSHDRYREIDPWGSYAVANIDHSHAVNDDIADIVGVYMAYNAYQKYLADLRKEGKKEKILPGLKQFSPQKLFWMKYGNMWCEHTEKSYLHALRHFHMHSPGNVRATLPLTRSKEWAKDFACPAPRKTDF